MEEVHNIAALPSAPQFGNFKNIDQYNSNLIAAVSCYNIN
jgi:hypothetical protein